MRSQATLWGTGALLLGSGLCALVYQIAWLREFRLVFGGSTAASAAVLAIFMGGLGLGGVLLGRRVDRSSRPLRFYALLEFGVTGFAALSPLLLDAIRAAYLKLGGTVELGLTSGTLLRLLLASAVLGIPTFLMGGTLPAAARAVESDDDRSRRRVGLLYGINTLGAVSGCLIATFYLLERFGNRATLWLACGLNLLVAVIAWQVARGLDDLTTRSRAAAPPAVRVAPPAYVLGAAATVGFAFFLMEIVWYRMLGPLLGGTVFTFGLILAAALAGIGVGGAIYYFAMRERPASLIGFATTCMAEALAVAIPLALGDRIALLAMFLRPDPIAPFAGHVMAWGVIVGIVVFPVAVIAGIQFPMLIALLGSGRRDVGRQIGATYLWNTVGAIAGSLAGGFGLIPLLSAPGCWRLVAVVLALLGLSAAFLALRSEVSFRRLAVHVVAALLVVAALAAPGPTAVWRHGGIGVLRTLIGDGPMARRDWIRNTRGFLTWEADGVESSVALSSSDGYTFIINGKSDGNVRADAPTQVMVGMLGAILHPDPRRSAVIGLGTGSTAGWLGAIPQMERVDVVELERTILRVADACASVNEDVLDNPKVEIRIADAREVLLTSTQAYDVIASEPSNPYRAGVASLFTREYYRAIADRLAPDGVLVQWLQVYDVDPGTLRTVYATLASVFPHLSTWQVGGADLALVASKAPLVYDVERLRARVGQEPYRDALSAAWRVVDLEGFLGRYVGNDALTSNILGGEPAPINTDDHTIVEFGFARAVGKGAPFRISDLHATARSQGSHRPRVVNGEVDWSRVEDAGIASALASDVAPAPQPFYGEDQRHLARALTAFVDGELREAIAAWVRRGKEPQGPTELALVAEGLAELGDDAALVYIRRLAQLQPIESSVILARFHLRQGRRDGAVTRLAASFASYRTDPWPSKVVMMRALMLAGELARTDEEIARLLFDVLEQPFAARINEGLRIYTRVRISEAIPGSEACVEALADFEPHFPWNEELLRFRADCYRRAGDARAERAQASVEELLRMKAGGAAAGGQASRLSSAR